MFIVRVGRVQLEGRAGGDQGRQAHGHCGEQEGVPDMRGAPAPGYAEDLGEERGA